MPNAATILEACIFATVTCVFFGIILKKNPIANIISIFKSMDVMMTGAIADYVLVASRGGLFAPMVSDNPQVAYADSVILTAIAIGFSIQALMLVGVMKLARDNPTLESHKIEKNNMP